MSSSGGGSGGGSSGSENNKDYSYDDTGINFSFFLCALLTIALVPYTYRFLFSKKPKFEDSSCCKCSKCKAKFNNNRWLETVSERKSRFIKSIFLAIAWAIYAVQVHKAITAVVTIPKQFDPWQILGVDKDATATVIRKSYYKLSLVFHPDKARNKNNSDAGENFLLISRAYFVLTDSNAYQNFLDFGNPDGQRPVSSGIALPRWLVDSKNSPLVLLGYIALFGLLIPLSINRWWRKNRCMTKDNVLYETMSTFFRCLHDSDSIEYVIALLCQAQDYIDDFAIEKDATSIKNNGQLVFADESRFNHVEKAITKIVGSSFPLPDVMSKRSVGKYTPNSPVAKKVWLILMAHMLRLESPASPRVTERIIVRAVHLLHRSIIPICFSRNWFMQSMFSLDLSQLLVQGMFTNSPPLLQLPHMTEEILLKSSLSPGPSRSVEDFVRVVNEAERKKRLSPHFSESQIADIEAFLDSYPRLVIEKFKCRVVGEDCITPNAIVTCTVALRVVTSKLIINTFSLVDDKKNASSSSSLENDESMFELEGQGDGGSGRKIRVAKRLPAAHAPLFPGEKPQTWHVMLVFADTNRIISHESITDLDDKAKSVLLRFEAPEKTGEFAFHLLIQSDHYSGSDVKLNVSIQIAPKKDRKYVEEVISDPDEDTIAGQMAIMRGHKISRSSSKPKKSSKTSKTKTTKSNNNSNSKKAAPPKPKSSSKAAIATASAASASAHANSKDKGKGKSKHQSNHKNGTNTSQNGSRKDNTSIVSDSGSSSDGDGSQGNSSSGSDSESDSNSDESEDGDDEYSDSD